MPEIVFEEPWVEAQQSLVEPHVDARLSIVSAERIDALLRPDVHHLTHSVCEGVGEDSSEVGSEGRAQERKGKYWESGGSP